MILFVCMDTILTFIMMLWGQWFGGVSTPVEPDSFPSEQSEVVEVVAIVDGDTIKVDRNGVTEIVRYIGIDTPELYRDSDEPACFGTQATDRNNALVAGKQVRLVADREDRDRYNRLLRYVYVDDINVNQTLVRDGYAITLTIAPNTAQAESLAAAQQAAQTDQVGLWSACMDTNVVEQSGVASISTKSATPETLTIKQTDLTSGQQRLLEILGIDTSVFTVTETMITCAQEVVGVDRLAEITGGELPSFMEGVRLVGCYR